MLRLPSVLLVLFLSALSLPAQAVRFATVAGEGVPGWRDGSASAARFAYPMGGASDLLGHIFIADTLNHVIRVVMPSGEVRTLAGRTGGAGFADGKGSAAQFNIPSAVVAGFDGDLYVADTGNHAIRHIDSSGNVTTLAGSPLSGWRDSRGSDARFTSPMGLALGSSGIVYVADTANHVIRTIDRNGNVRTLAGRPRSAGSDDGFYDAATFTFPTGLCMTPSGELAVTDAGSGLVRIVTLAGSVRTIAGPTASTLLKFSRPTSVAADPFGSLYVVNQSDGQIARIAADGKLSLFDFSNSRDQLDHPFGLFVDPAGALFVIDTQHSRIVALTRAGGKKRGVRH